MQTPNPKPDPQLDALLDAALAPETPASQMDDLSQRILAQTAPQGIPTDPRIEALLDEALRPNAQADLAERILASTPLHAPQPVLARIGFTPARAASAAGLAAAIALAFGLFVLLNPADDTRTTITTNHTDTPAPNQPDAPLADDTPALETLETQIAVIDDLDTFVSVTSQDELFDETELAFQEDEFWAMNDPFFDDATEAYPTTDENWEVF